MYKWYCEIESAQIETGTGEGEKEREKKGGKAKMIRKEGKIETKVS